MSEPVLLRAEKSPTTDNGRKADSEVIHRPIQQLREWQELVLSILLTATVVLGLVAIIAEAFLVIPEGRWDVLATIVVAYSLVVVLAVVRRIPYHVRAVAFLIVFYFVSLFDLTQSGLSGDGRLFLLAFPLLAFVLLGRWGGIGGMVLSLVSLAVVGWAMATGRLIPAFEAHSAEVMPWFTAIAIYMLLALVVLLPTSYVVNNLVINLGHALEEARRRWQEVRQLSRGLERQVVDRTKELAQRSEKLEAAMQVAREVAAIRDVGPLLDASVRLICERFVFYHTGIFLLDEPGEFAVLRTASSEGGRRMLERGHKLAVGHESIVGHVASTGRPRIALDVGEDVVFFDNPDLPHTRSEMALPLQIRGQVIGVLDVQSTQEAAFSKEDIAILQTMADQVALAVENARLLQESQRALRELGFAYGEYARAAWEGLEMLPAFEYDRVEVAPAAPGLRPSVERALSTRQLVTLAEPEDDHSALVAPLRLRDQVIGAIGLEETDEAREWTADEIAIVEAVSEQVAQALENARLFGETRRRAEEQQGLARIAALVGSTLDLDELLARLVDETVQLLGARLGVLLLLDEGQKTLVDHYLSREARLRLTPGEWRVPLDTPGFEQSVFSRGGTYYTNQAQTDPNILPAYRPYVAALEAESFCGVALRARDRSIGELYVVDRPGGFGPEQARLLRTVMGYVANAIENARLFEETQHALGEMEALYRTVQVVGAELDLDVLTQKLIDEASRLVGADYGVLAVLDPTTGGIQYFKTAGIEPGRCPLTHLPQGKGLLKLLLEGQTLRVDNIREHPSYGGYLPTGHLPIVSFLGLPLLYQNQVRGLLAVSNRATGPIFDQADENLLGTFVAQATVTLENVRLFEEARRRVEETQLLLRVSETAASTLESTEVMRGIAREAARALGADMTGAYLLDETGKKLRVVAGYHIPREKLEIYQNFRIPVEGHPFVEEAWTSRRTTFTSNAPDDPRFDEETQRIFPAHSVLLTPMIVKETIIGGLWAVWWEETHHFTEDETRLVEGIVRQAAIAVENARLFEEAQRRARRERLAREIAGRIQAAGDVEAVLQTAVRELGRALGTPRSFVQLGTPGQFDAPPSRAPSAQKSPDAK